MYKENEENLTETGAQKIQSLWLHLGSEDGHRECTQCPSAYNKWELVT